MVEIGLIILEKKIFEICQCIFIILLFSPLEKGQATSFEQIKIPFNQGCFVPRSIKIGSVVLEKKMKMWKVYDDNDNDDNDNNDDDGQRTSFDQKSSLEPSAQVS